jgi:putative flippase GtrA
VGWSEADETRKQLSRFLVVGLLSVVTDLTVYALLVSVAGWPVSASKGISYAAGVVIGFVLNKHWTFESSRESWREAASYLSLYSVTLGVNVGCNYAALRVLGNDRRALAYLFATGVTTILNFIGMRLFTFRKGIADRREAIIESPARELARRKAS